jgi:predicted metal-dependent phosphotriesterase family hydrolase
MIEQRQEEQRENEQSAMKQAAKIKVLIVDDHPIMRVGIAAIIDATPDMTVR